MEAYAVLLMFFFVCAGVQAQRPGFGKCPNVGTEKTLDIDKIKGKWFEVERSFYVYELNRRCITVEMTPTINGMYITSRAISRLSGDAISDEAEAVPIKPNSASLRVAVNSSLRRRLPSALSNILPGTGDYTVLHTDYDNFAVVYSCSNIASIMHADLVWVLARTPDLPAHHRGVIYGVLERAGLNSDGLTLSPQRDCPKNN